MQPRLATLAGIVDARGRRLDEGLALFFAAPASYTGEDVLELHVHGSPAVARETLIAVLEAGARLARPGEFTRRAYLAGKVSERDMCGEMVQMYAGLRDGELDEPSRQNGFAAASPRSVAAWSAASSASKSRQSQICILA